MSSLLLMEWNATPLQWDWENQVMFNAKATENPKKLQPSDWGIGVGEIDFGSPISSGGGDGSGSDVRNTSLSRSSKSASVNSSSVGEIKTSKFPEDFGSKKELANARPTGNSPMLEASVGSAEPLLDLKLGKRTYFEDVCAGSNANTSSCAAIFMSSATPAKRSKSNSQGAHAPRCQVEGCNLDLSSAKDYHRKHRVCESHSKCPEVIVGGLELRFCQQCSRFHGLSEFDAKKRSCRRRLSDHNVRRRKPQPEPVRLCQARLSSSQNDWRQQTSLVWNRVPLLHTKPAANLTWESTCGSKFTQTKEYMLKPAKGGGTEGQLHLPRNELPNVFTTLLHDSNRLLPPKGTTSEILNQGLEESIISSNLDASQDLHRALSLLSTNSWGSSEAKPLFLDHPMHTIHTSMPQPVIHAMPQGLPLASAEYWRTERQPNNSQLHTLTSRSDGSSHFQEFQLFRAPYESGFHSNQLN